MWIEIARILSSNAHLDDCSEDEESFLKSLRAVDGQDVGDFREEVTHGRRVAAVDLLDQRVQTLTSGPAHFRRVSQ